MLKFFSLSRNAQFRSVTFHDERGLPDRYWTIVEASSENDNKRLLENIMTGSNVGNMTMNNPYGIPQQLHMPANMIQNPNDPMSFQMRPGSIPNPSFVSYFSH